MKTNVSVNTLHDHIRTSKQGKRHIKQIRRNRNVQRMIKRGSL